MSGVRNSSGPRSSGSRWTNVPGAALTATAGLIVAAAISLVLAAPAPAQDRSAYVPTGLTGLVDRPHFQLHYNPATPSPEAGMTIGQYAAAGAADLEESYGRLITGGSGTPNAGLKQPNPDSDGKTDVYLAAPKNKPDFIGGIVYRDSGGWTSSYMFLTPDLKRSGFRFRTAHEFMHVIQNGYTGMYVHGFTESFSNWASEWALRDVDPLDSNFYGDNFSYLPHPWMPLDCTYESWEGVDCGSGYWQWLFVQAQVEDYGPDFVTTWQQRFKDVLGTPEDDLIPLLQYTINNQSGGTADLRSRFHAYAHDVWDPTRWTTNAIRKLKDEEGTTPASYLYSVADQDSGMQQISIDHLAARYVEVRGYPEVMDPGDVVELTWQHPPGMAGPIVPMIKRVGQEAWEEAGRFNIDQGTVQVDLGPTVETVVLPLVNDSLTADDQPFSYRVRLPDTEAPNTSFRRHPPRRTEEHKARFRFAASERGVEFQCKLDRGKFKGCTSPKAVRVNRGKHTFQIRATDEAGNVEPKPARWRWRVTG